MNQREVNRKLLNQWIEMQKELTTEQKKTLEKWFAGYGEKAEELYKIYKKILECNEAEYIGQGISLPNAKWRQLLSGAIELIQPILPLGSVVDLKKEKLQGKLPKLEQVERVRIVITQRFLSYTETGYFTYAGVVYPLGNMQGNQIIHFNPLMIQGLVKKGYEDEQDAAYVYLMKQEYVLQKGMRNYEFASEEETHQLIRVMEGMNVKRN